MLRKEFEPASDNIQQETYASVLPGQAEQFSISQACRTHIYFALNRDKRKLCATKSHFYQPTVAMSHMKLTLPLFLSFEDTHSSNTKNEFVEGELSAIPHSLPFTWQTEISRTWPRQTHHTSGSIVTIFNKTLLLTLDNSGLVLASLSQRHVTVASYT
jgi:hypothetical protein